MQPLTLALIQTRTHWHDAAANRVLFDRWLAQVPAAADVVVLPEMFSSGFTMAAEAVAEPVDGPTVGWLREHAARLGKVVCGSLVIADAGACFNRFLWATPDGELAGYDKRHRFRMAGEHEHYAAGTQRVVLTVRGWRVLPLVCYDLRFPVWLRNDYEHGSGYDLLLCVANWPAARQVAWNTLLRARAIENLAYAAGVNVVGRDGNGIDYTGGSAAYAPDGAELVEAGDRSGVFVVTLDPEHLRAHRERFPAWQDADAFRLL